MDINNLARVTIAMDSGKRSEGKGKKRAWWEGGKKWLVGKMYLGRKVGRTEGKKRNEKTWERGENVSVF